MMWGQINPTKPITPPAQTAAAAAMEPATKQRIWTFFVFRPSPSEVKLPLESKSSGFMQNKKRTKEIMEGIIKNFSSSKPFELKLPKVHIYILYISLSRINIIAEVRADKKTLTAFPASKSLIGSWLDFLPQERKNTSTMHKIAPTKAPKGIQTPSPEPMVAPKAAPAVTPSIEESASGLLKNPWNTAPEPAKREPHKRAKRVRGRRISNKMILTNLSCFISCKEIDSLPKSNPAIKTRGSMIKREITTILVLDFSLKMDIHLF